MAEARQEPSFDEFYVAYFDRLVGQLTLVTGSLHEAEDVVQEDEPRRLISAARQAWAAFDAPLAERLARAALGGGARIEAAQLLSDLLVYGGRAQEAEELLATFPFRPIGEEERARLALARAFNLFSRVQPVLGAGPRRGGHDAPRRDGTFAHRAVLAGRDRRHAGPLPGERRPLPCGAATA
jgi:DNA-directed RNA polymerase specialized sigma24 family protein